MRIRTLSLAMLGLYSAAGVGAAHAAGFALIEQNASGLGNAYAGQAASAQDASTIFFNPAGLTRIEGRQMVAVANFIRPSAEFANTTSGAAPLQALGANGGDAGGWAVVPNFYYTMDIKPDVKFGLGVNAPFGLRTKYEPDWIGRYHAIKSDVKTLNINPTIAFKANDSVSIGIGLDAQQVKAALSNLVNYSAIFASPSTPAALRHVAPGISGLALIEGDDWTWGYNLGVLFTPDANTRIGVNYRSSMDYTLEGTATFSRPAGLSATQTAILNAAVPDGAVTAEVELPDTFSISLFKTVSPQVDLLADITWTNWSVFKDLTVKRASGTVLTTTPENWNDNLRYSVGMNYRADDKMTWRVGLAYDETPVENAFRTPRIPDESRTWLAVGGQYKLDKQSAIDFGYAHLFVKDASINQASASGGALVGKYDNAVDIVSVQYTRSF
jgi:long-chain fatty acid transport protein